MIVGNIFLRLAKYDERPWASGDILFIGASILIFLSTCINCPLGINVNFDLFTASHL